MNVLCDKTYKMNAMATMTTMTTVMTMTIITTMTETVIQIYTQIESDFVTQ